MDRQLRKAGWRVVRIWEHALAKKRALRTLARIGRAPALRLLPNRSRHRPNTWPTTSLPPSAAGVHGFHALLQST